MKAETQELVDNCLKVIALRQIPAKNRTDSDTEEIAEITRKQAKNLRIAFQELTSKLFTRITWADGNGLKETHDHWVKVLTEQETQPKLPKQVDSSGELSKALVHNTNAYATINGGLEELKPMIESFDLYLERAESIARGLCGEHSNQWVASDAFQLLIPEDAVFQVASYRELVSRLSTRLSALDKLIFSISRSITQLEAGNNQPESRGTTVPAQEKPWQRFKKG